MIPEGLMRYPTNAGREALAARLGLPIDPYSQDWEWEAAAPERFAEWLGIYRREPLSDDERFSLMEILVQCVEDLCEGRMPADGAEALPEWQAVAAEIRGRPRLHAATVAYWAVPEASEPEEHFTVSIPMRRLWAEVQNAVLSDL